MKRLYIGSMTGNSGKQVITLGLGLCLKQRGLSLAYIKPIGKDPLYIKGNVVDADAEVFHRALGLEQPLEKTSPLVYTIELLTKAMAGRLRGVGQRVKKEITSLKADVVLIAGTTDIFEGSIFGINGLEISKLPQTKVLLVERWRPEETVDDVIAGKQLFGKTLTGIILNRVSEDSLQEVKKEVVTYLQKKGVKVLGVVPEERRLAAVTVRVLAETLGAEVLCAKENLGALVEHFSIGAMDVPNALKYFQRTSNKAVITGAHRADIQMAALETSTKCIVLTGGGLPNDVIIGKATEAGVPLLSVKDDTYTTVEKIESLLGRAKVRDPERLPLVKNLVEKYIDIERLL